MADAPKTSQRAQRYLLVGGLLVGLVLVSVLLGSAIRQKSLIMSEVRAAADALFENIVTTRRWNADHGGVYVLKRPGVDSNPYLRNPDIRAVDGQVYTKKNPALMTREVSEYATKRGAYTFHITSLNLLNPDNAPDTWEEASLAAFEGGESVRTTVATLDGREVFRLMRPLYYEPSCGACHGDQGYADGDVRGGITVNVPFTRTREALTTNRNGTILLGLLVIGFLVFVLYFFVWRMMNRVAEQNRELADLNALKTRFLGMAAHDLGNPIAVVQGYLRLLSSAHVDLGANPEKRARIINKMDAACGRMIELIHDLVDINTIDAGGIELHPHPLPIDDYLEGYVDTNHVLAEDRGLELVLNVEPGLPKVLADEARLEQILNNLLSNALKYSGADTVVTLSARAGEAARTDESENEVVISLADQGQGIAAEELGRLFVEFGKTSATPAKGTRSTGLGLAITKRLVDAHNGRVWVESKQGEGSTFFVALPIAPKQDGTRGN